MFFHKSSFIAAASMCMMMLPIVVSQGLGSDYLEPLTAPPTIYESSEMSPQTMDFDVETNMFMAHSGWYNDRLIHYYKFRIFAPSTYPGVVTPDGGSRSVPLQKVYFVTTTGDFDGVVGQPIVEYHTQDGVNYSDFMIVTFVQAPADYTADTFMSVGDITSSGASIIDTDIVLNMPVVPTGSTLQHPIERSSVAPIDPVPAFYKGVEVWTYVFEVSDIRAAEYFAFTRPTSDSSSFSVARQANMETGFEIPVVDTFATPEFVAAIPIWHVNQFGEGVVEGMGGGPDPMGMRNVIDADRPDSGYSPLWQIFWATEMPINYEPDQFSNAQVATEANGFVFFTTPMFVNCPNVGLVGDELNPKRQDTFKTKIMIEHDHDGEETMEGKSFLLTGSHSSMVMQGGVALSITTDQGEELGTTETNMMGGYEYYVAEMDIPEGTTSIMVVRQDDETVIRTIEVQHGDVEEGTEEEVEDSSAFALAGKGIFASMFAVTAMAILL